MRQANLWIVGEVISRPRGQRGHEGEGRQEGGAASAPSRIPAGEDHEHVHGPHQQRQQNLGIKKIHAAVGGEGHDRAGQQAQRHERKAQQQRAVADLVDHFERGQKRNQAGGFLGFQAALLQQIEQAGAEAEHQRGVAGEDEDDVGDEPSLVRDELGQQHRLLADGRNEGQKKYHGKDHHAGRCGLIDRIDDHEEGHRQKCQQRLSVVHRRPDDLARKKQLGQRDEVENHAQAGRMQGDAAEQVTGAGERHEGVDQPDEVAPQCETQPKQRHRPYKFRNPLSLPQIAGPVPNPLVRDLFSTEARARQTKGVT